MTETKTNIETDEFTLAWESVRDWIQENIEKFQGDEEYEAYGLFRKQENDCIIQDRELERKLEEIGFTPIDAIYEFINRGFLKKFDEITSFKRLEKIAGVYRYFYRADFQEIDGNISSTTLT
jgi:hypothetical protein